MELVDGRERTRCYEFSNSERRRRRTYNKIESNDTKEIPVLSTLRAVKSDS